MLTYQTAPFDLPTDSRTIRILQIANGNKIKNRDVVNRDAVKRRHLGFTLIEVLIALTVLSIGLLGLVTLQTRSLATSHSAYLSSIASIQAMNLAEMIRANPEGAVTYENGRLDQLNPFILSMTCTSAVTNGCDPAELARNHMNRWAYNTRQKFPPNLHINLMTEAHPGSVCPSTTGTRNTEYRLELCWRTPIDDAQRHFVYAFGQVKS